MQLQSENLAHYLLARGELELERVMSGDFMVGDAGRRNKNFKVVHQDGSGSFVKQVRNDDVTARATLKREAELYRALAEPSLSRVAALCPKLVAWHEAESILLVELLRNGRSLQDLQNGTGELRLDWARLAGEALATLHANCRAALAAGALSVLPALPGRAPWIFSLPDWNASPSPLSPLSPSNAQLVRLVRVDRLLASGLWCLRRDWVASSLIHGDMKWDNLVLIDSEPPSVRFVDWELADLGDPAWDVAGLLQSLLVHWLGRFPDLAGQSWESLFANEEAASELRAASTSVLRAYRTRTEAAAGTTALGWSAFVERVTRMVGARLLQTVYEVEAASPMLGGRSAVVVGLCGQLVSRPDTVLRSLFRGST